MRRVAVIGPPGAGKSTLSRELARATGLPLIHLDRHFWNEGWIATPRAEWECVQRELIEGPRWIIDGNYGSTLDIRLEAADTVVLLDLPRHVYIGRVVTRMLRGFILGEERDDLAAGCPERPDLNWFRFLAWVWHFHRDGRPGLLQHLRCLPPDTRLFWLTRPRDVQGLSVILVGRTGAPSQR